VGSAGQSGTRSPSLYRSRIRAGWVAFACLGIPGLLSVLWLGAPSDPCSPGAADCGPEPWGVFQFGLVLIAAADLGMLWAAFWEFKRRKMTSQHQDSPVLTSPSR
jgi:hypothetical protein